MNRPQSVSDAIEHPVVVWFQSSKRNDAILSIKKTSTDLYKVVLIDKVMNDKSFKMYFSTYHELCKYLDLYFDNMLLDKDTLTPFEFIQWNIPGFTSSIIDLKDIADDYVYRTFTDCLNVFFSQ